MSRSIAVLVVVVNGPTPEIVGIASAAPCQFVEMASPQPRKISPGTIHNVRPPVDEAIQHANAINALMIQAR